jgi:EmrB/QacA subfamily drug resistance transporter
MTTTRDGSTSQTRHPTALLIVILVSYLMIIIDNSIVITGIPLIQDELDLTPTGVSWVQNAYTLTFGGLLLLAARSGDVFGRRRVFLIGLVLFAVSSLAVGAAPTGPLLIAARAVQGVGSAILAPSTLALLTAGFPAGRERVRAVAAYGSVAGIGAALGLVLGGLVADALSWRVGFFINLPIGLGLYLAARRYVAPSPGLGGRLDVTGALTSTLGMTALVYGIVRAADAGWSDPGTVSSLASGVLLLVAFVRIESRAAAPIMPLRLFASRERSGAYGARLLFIGGMISYFLFLSQFLQGVHGFTPLQAGAAFLPMTVVNFGTAVMVPRLTARFGGPRLLLVGVAVTAVGMAWLSRLSGDGTYLADVALPLVLIGAGQGFAFGPLTASGIAGVRGQDAGAASGLVNAAHQLGGALGLGILVTVSQAASRGETATAQLTSRSQAALTGSAAMLALAVVLVAVLIVPAHRREVRRQAGAAAAARGAPDAPAAPPAPSTPSRATR